MASLKRTFAVLANPMVRGIPTQVRHQLLKLSALYSAHDEEDEQVAWSATGHESETDEDREGSTHRSIHERRRCGAQTEQVEAGAKQPCYSAPPVSGT